MTTSDLDPDALATRAEAIRICRECASVLRQGTPAILIAAIDTALREAEKRGAKAEQARIFHTDTFGSGATLSREPGVTGKPRCRFYGDDDRANHDCHINMALAVPPCKGKCDWKEPPGVTGKGEGNNDSL